MTRGLRTIGEGWPLTSKRSAALFAQAEESIPGGVQGDARRCEPHPLYMHYADGSRIRDVDNNEYCDFHAAFGAVLLGHNHSAVRAELFRAIRENGITFGTCHPWEIELAETIARLVPEAESVVFPTTGSEAVAFALRLARAFTDRSLILKFEGNYHGSSDIAYTSVSLPSGMGGPRAQPDAVPGSDGMVPGAAENVIVREYNDLQGLREAMQIYGRRVAAIVVEPVFFNGGVIEPAAGFLPACRRLADDHGAVLIFDQLITGFREALGGAAVTEGVMPDLSTFGKALSNGLPIAALCGRSEIMDQLSPLGRAYFSGTHAGHLLNVRAALACLRALETSPPYEHLASLGDALSTEVNATIARLGLRAHLKYRSGVFALYLTDQAVTNYRNLVTATSAKAVPLQTAYLQTLNRHGIYMHPFWVLRGYLMDAHTETDIERLINATTEFLHAHRRELSEV